MANNKDYSTENCDQQQYYCTGLPMGLIVWSTV